MSRPIARPLVHFILIALLLPFLSRAADLAVLPYKLVYDIQKKGAEMSQTYTNLHIYVRVKSTLPAVKNSDLSLYIDSKDGKIPVDLDPNGRFTVPMLQSLLDDSASIVVNQPKGTMEFGWFVGLVLENIPTNGVHYNDLMHPLQDVETIRAEMLPGSASFAIHGMKFIYSKAANAAVTIHAKDGDRTFSTDDSHTLVIPWEPALRAENPTLAIPLPPSKLDVAEGDEK